MESEIHEQAEKSVHAPVIKAPQTFRGIKETGNNHLRRILIECAWSYRYQAAMSEAIKKRQEGQPASLQAIAWKAQVRLCKKYRRLVSRCTVLFQNHQFTCFSGRPRRLREPRLRRYA